MPGKVFNPWMSSFPRFLESAGRLLRSAVVPCVVATSLAVAAPSLGSDGHPGERYHAVNTTRIGTILGYGRPMERTAAPPHVASSGAGGDVVWGADIGLPVTMDLVLEGRTDTQPVTYFFFGDTDLLDHQRLLEGWVQPYQAADGETAADYGVIQGDGFAFTLDTTPNDGLFLSHFFRNREDGESGRLCGEVLDDGFRAMYVPGVHAAGPCSSALPVDGDLYWLFLTPTGAWAMDDSLFVMIADQTPYDGFPQASSYLAASTNLGLGWTALNGGRPISSPDIANSWRSKFVHVDALPVDAADYQDDARSGPCKLPLPPGSDTRGFLLFGAGLWTQSDIFLAFVSRSELRAAVADPSRSIRMSYFRGESEGGCWSDDQADAVPVVKALDDSAWAFMELPCGNHVIQGSVGAGYVTVTRLAGTLANGTAVDRMVMLYDSAYLVCTAASPDPCCGGTLGQDGVCTGDFSDDFSQYVQEGSAGVVMVTGDPWKPWIWNYDTGSDAASTVPEKDQRAQTSPVPPPEQRQLLPQVVPPDPAANWWGDGPQCEQVRQWDDFLAGYAPLIVDRFSGPSADGTGFDLYFVLSRWGTKLNPQDPCEADAGCHYMVDLFRTTIRPFPPGHPDQPRTPVHIRRRLPLQGGSLPQRR